METWQIWGWGILISAFILPIILFITKEIYAKKQNNKRNAERKLRLFEKYGMDVGSKLYNGGLWQGAEKVCQDEFGYWLNENSICLAIADGAGGSLDGESASKQVIQSVGRSFKSESLVSLKAELKSLDCSISIGESTGIILVISDGALMGASVGDSRAMIVKNDDLIELTSNQIRKLLLGSGLSNPVEFKHSYNGELIIVGTDGFWNYCKQDKILPIVYFNDFSILAKKLVDSCRLNSGKLNDDAAVLCLRKKRIKKTLKY